MFTNAGLQALLERLEDSELDDQTDIITLIGIEFDENTAWGQLTILELKLLIHLALKQFEAAQELVQAFLQYNENTVERGLFYQALNVVLEVMLDDDLELDDYVVNFRRMFGDARMHALPGDRNCECHANGAWLMNRPFQHQHQLSEGLLKIASRSSILLTGRSRPV